MEIVNAYSVLFLCLIKWELISAQKAPQHWQLWGIGCMLHCERSLQRTRWHHIEGFKNSACFVFIYISNKVRERSDTNIIFSHRCAYLLLHLWPRTNTWRHSRCLLFIWFPSASDLPKKTHKHTKSLVYKIRQKRTFICSSWLVWVGIRLRRLASNDLF